jgi:hypothetical protein
MVIMAREIYVQTETGIVLKAVDGQLTKEYLKKASQGKTNPYNGFGSDTLGSNVNGVLNHADGKRYDSKSQYERAVRAKGWLENSS